MFITTRQLNAALSGIKIARNFSEDPVKDKEFYKGFQESLEGNVKQCLKEELAGLEITDLELAKLIANIAQIHDSEINKRERRR